MNLSKFCVSKIVCVLLTLVLFIDYADAQSFSYQGSNDITVMTVVGPVPITFSDPDVAKKVRATLGLPEDAEITDVKLLDLYSLDVSSSLVESLVGLEYAQNLRYLDASNNGISDITPLTSLTELRFLDLSRNNNITNGAPLASLGKLNTLSISGTKISNLDFLVPIADFQQQSNGEYALERLYFSKFFVDRINYGVRDISMLSRFQKLSTIHADNNRIESLAPLVPLMNENKVLKHLYVAGNYLNDIGEIIPSTGNTSSLQALDFSRCFLSTIGGLETAKFPALTEIDISLNYLNMEDNSDDRGIIGKFAEVAENTVIFLPQRVNIWAAADIISLYETGTMYQNTSFFPSDDYQFIFKSIPNWIYSFKYGFIYFLDDPQVDFRYLAFFGYTYEKYNTEEDPYKDLRKWISIDFVNLPYGNGTMYTFNSDNTISEYFGAIPTLITE